MKASAERLIEVFNEARTRAVGPQREQYLTESCKDDPELKAQVLSLLQAHEESADFLKNVPGLVTEKPGDRIGPYKLLEKLGEGGFGVVYRAEQQTPVRRHVALKIVKAGMDTRQVIARFEAERQALALMDHPNIARVLDAGATESGRPYFVMELVRGMPITDYCDHNCLSARDRLELFLPVCKAVQHAHDKGVIHRDLKPSNIMVTIIDNVPAPKVIDFGIAKATEQPLTERTLFTHFQQFMGTPAYVSPEQAQLTTLDIDSRADIYSLGVVLYELLTGRIPFDFRPVMREGMDALRRAIREIDPVRPSTRLSALSADDLTTVAKRRSAEPVKLISLLCGDLDWITLKCLEKSRTRRYPSAHELAADLQRHLRNEPVQARPPNPVYRFRKLVRRHRVAFSTAAVIAILSALVITLATSPLIQKVKRTPAKVAAYPVVFGLLPRSLQTPANLLDLSPFYNMSLEGSHGWQIDERSTHAIQKGPQRLGDVTFDVRGGIRLASPSPSYAGLPYPKRVNGIQVSRKCQRLHFLHFVFGAEKAAVPVANYRIHYADGNTWDVPVKYAHDVRTWTDWKESDPRYDLDGTNSALVWTGTNVNAQGVRLFRSSWDNPRPDAEIRTIDFISGMTGSCPVLVAITAEP